MTSIILTQTASFLFDNDAYLSDGPHYKITTVVNTLGDTNRKRYFDIQYHYEFVCDSELEDELALHYMQTMHPFRHYNVEGEEVDLMRCQYGRVFTKNAMTCAMVDYLLMDDETLSEYCGDVTTQKYRRNIMLALSYF